MDLRNVCVWVQTADAKQLAAVTAALDSRLAEKGWSYVAGDAFDPPKGPTGEMLWTVRYLNVERLCGWVANLDEVSAKQLRATIAAKK